MMGTSRLVSKLVTLIGSNLTGSASSDWIILLSARRNSSEFRISLVRFRKVSLVLAVEDVWKDCVLFEEEEDRDCLWEVDEAFLLLFSRGGSLVPGRIGVLCDS